MVRCREPHARRQFTQRSRTRRCWLSRISLPRVLKGRSTFRKPHKPMKRKAAHLLGQLQGLCDKLRASFQASFTFKHGSSLLGSMPRKRLCTALGRSPRAAGRWRAVQGGETVARRCISWLDMASSCESPAAAQVSTSMAPAAQPIGCDPLSPLSPATWTQLLDSLLDSLRKR